MVAGRDVLVTGGCGSLGSATVEHLLRHRSPSSVVVFDNDEQGLFASEQRLDDAAPVRYELGNVRNEDRVREVVESVDLVVHTAGLKQVPGCELHPGEAVRTNAVGTENVVRAARWADVESVLTLTTDKGVAPSSSMGASKMLAERITLAADRRSGPDGPSFACVRLGNAVGSAGSVVRVFERQIEAGEPLTVTDPEMTRFGTTPERVARFICRHLEGSVGGTTYVPRMPAFRVGDLASAMLAEYADEDLGTEIVGPRPGERTHELLIAPFEAHRAWDMDEEFVVQSPIVRDDAPDADRWSEEPPIQATDGGSVPPDATPLSSDGYASDDAELLSQAEIVGLLEGDEAV